MWCPCGCCRRTLPRVSDSLSRAGFRPALHGRWHTSDCVVPPSASVCGSDIGPHRPRAIGGRFAETHRFSPRAAVQLRPRNAYDIVPGSLYTGQAGIYARSVAISVPLCEGHQGWWGDLCQCGIHLPCRIMPIKGRTWMHPYVAPLRHTDEPQGTNPRWLDTSCEKIRQGDIQHTRQAQIEHQCWLHTADLPFIDRSGAAPNIWASLVRQTRSLAIRINSDSCSLVNNGGL